MGKKVDRGRIREAVRQERVISIKTISYFADERAYIDEVLEVFLEEANLTEYANKIAYCVHELAGNAWKGNVKRAYFHELGLDINDPADYERGMETFRADTLSDITRYTDMQRELGIHFRVDFRLRGEEARIAVRQNTRLTDFERKRIEEKLALAAEHATMVTAYESAEDTSEGAGLGLIMTILMLRNIGLNDHVLDSSFNDGEAVLSLRLARLRQENLQSA
ncbi:MAG: hypothetical protein ACLFO1_05625 [Spirochaetaceae bacterium]